MTYSSTGSRQVQRTRTAVLSAFRDLFFEKRYAEIRIADVVEAANVGRSTFYEHFKSKDDLLIASLAPLLEPLANAAVGRGDLDQVSAVLSHFRGQTARARSMFSGVLYFKIVDGHTQLIASRLSVDTEDEGLAMAIERSSAQLGVIRAWILGQLPLTADDIAARLVAD